MISGVQLAKEFEFLSKSNLVHQALREQFAQKVALEWSPEVIDMENERLEGINELLIKHKYADLEAMHPVTFLDLSGLGLTRLPKKLLEILGNVQLKWQIKSISFANNYLTTLPEEIFSLGYLTTVDISNNPLDEAQLKEISRKYPHITFAAENNPFVDVPLDTEAPIKPVTPALDQARQQSRDDRQQSKAAQPAPRLRKGCCLLV